MRIPVLPYRGEIFEEVRYANFLEKTGYTTTPLPMKILSFGDAIIHAHTARGTGTVRKANTSKAACGWSFRK